MLGEYFKNCRGDVIRPNYISNELVECNYITSEGDDMGGGSWYPLEGFGDNLIRIEGDELKRFLILNKLKG